MFACTNVSYLSLPCPKPISGTFSSAPTQVYFGLTPYWHHLRVSSSSILPFTCKSCDQDQWFLGRNGGDYPIAIVTYNSGIWSNVIYLWDSSR